MSLVERSGVLCWREGTAEVGTWGRDWSGCVGCGTGWCWGSGDGGGPSLGVGMVLVCFLIWDSAIVLSCACGWCGGEVFTAGVRSDAEAVRTICGPPLSVRAFTRLGYALKHYKGCAVSFS